MAAQRDRNGNRDVRPARLAPRFPTEENRTDASGPVTARRIGALCWGACVAATLGTLILLVPSRSRPSAGGPSWRALSR